MQDQKHKAPPLFEDVKAIQPYPPTLEVTIMFSFFAKFFSTLSKLLSIVDTNANSILNLSYIGESMSIDKLESSIPTDAYRAHLIASGVSGISPTKPTAVLPAPKA